MLKLIYIHSKNKSYLQEDKKYIQRNTARVIKRIKWIYIDIHIYIHEIFI